MQALRPTGMTHDTAVVDGTSMAAARAHRSKHFDERGRIASQVRPRCPIVRSPGLTGRDFSRRASMGSGYDRSPSQKGVRFSSGPDGLASFEPPIDAGSK